MGKIKILFFAVIFFGFSLSVSADSLKPYFWVGWDETAPASVGFNYAPIVGDLREVVVYDASGNDIGLGLPTVENSNAPYRHRINDVNAGGFNFPYKVFLIVSGDSCSDYIDCSSRYDIYQTIVARQNVSHCDYSFQTYVGLLDSYPVIQASNCYSLSQDSASFDEGNIVFGQSIIIVMLFLMVVGYLWNNMNTKKPWQ